MDNVYNFMQKRKHIYLGQVFTPLHIATFAAKLLNITPEDKVLDACAGTGALLLAAANIGAKNLYGCEFDPEVYAKLENNLKETGLTYEAVNMDAASQEAAEWIKIIKPTKVILNPPYEKKYNTFGILINILDALEPGTPVALFYPCNHFDKPTKTWKKHFSENHRVDKIIKLPDNIFSPFASVSTSLFIITAGIPQNGEHIWGCNIEDDGLERKKGEYRIDRHGIWKNEKEPYWYNVITTGTGDETIEDIDPESGLSYRKQIDSESLRPTEADFRKCVAEYLSWKVSQVMKGNMTIEEATSNGEY